MTLENHKALSLGVLLLGGALLVGAAALTPSAPTLVAPSVHRAGPDGGAPELEMGLQAHSHDRTDRTAYERIQAVNEKSETARKAQGHLTHDRKSFETYAALSKYRRAEVRRARLMPLVHDGYQELHPDDAALWEE